MRGVNFIKIVKPFTVKNFERKLDAKKKVASRLAIIIVPNKNQPNEYDKESKKF